MLNQPDFCRFTHEHLSYSWTLSPLRLLRQLVTPALGLVATVLSIPAFAINDHLLLCEAVVTPTSDEFIEIHNPTDAPIDLTNYYWSHRIIR